MKNTAKNTAQDKQLGRLPCRGCTRHCKNHAHCKGRPWRMQGPVTPRT